MKRSMINPLSKFELREIAKYYKELQSNSSSSKLNRLERNKTQTIVQFAIF